MVNWHPLKPFGTLWKVQVCILLLYMFVYTYSTYPNIIGYRPSLDHQISSKHERLEPTNFWARFQALVSGEYVQAHIRDTVCFLCMYIYNIYIYRIFHIIMYISGQIILFHQPAFPSNRRFPFQKIYLLKAWGRVRALSQPFLSWPQYWSLAPTKPGTATCDVPPFEAEEMCWNGNPTMGTRNPRFLEA